MKPFATLTAFALLGLFAAQAEDVKLSNGRILKGAEVQSIWPDGVVLKVNGTITKYWWSYLHPEEKARMQAKGSEMEVEKQLALLLKKVEIPAVIEPYIFGPERTKIRLQQYKSVSTGEFTNEGLNRIPVKRWDPVGDIVYGVLDEPMEEGVGDGDTVVMFLYHIGHTEDVGRDRLFTRDTAKAKAYLLKQARSPQVASAK